MAFNEATYLDVASVLSLKTLPVLRALQIKRGYATLPETAAEFELYNGLLELAQYPEQDVRKAMLELGMNRR